MKFDEAIAEHSTWLTNTPSQIEKSLPFYIMEAGHFFAYQDYVICRSYHDSYLFLFTIRGNGKISINQNTHTLLPGQAILIDCHKPHEYYAVTDQWEFLWLHTNGEGMYSMYPLLYSGTPFPIQLADTENMLSVFDYIFHQMMSPGIESSLALSLKLHQLCNDMIRFALQTEQTNQKRSYEQEMQLVVAFLQEHLQEQITVEDMLSLVSISKYHFIRLFKRSFGVTPYHYLNTLRINHAKTLLRTSDLPIADIAWKCGFQDTSNFIYQFKKCTGQKPTSYRKDFATIN